MRRRLSLVLIAVLVVVAVALSFGYLGDGNRMRRIAPVDTAADALAQADSAARANARATRDTMCLAARIGLPCDDR